MRLAAGIISGKYARGAKTDALLKEFSEKG